MLPIFGSKMKSTLFFGLLLIAFACQKANIPQAKPEIVENKDNISDMELWISSAINQNRLFKVSNNFHFKDGEVNLPLIKIDTSLRFQTIDGFGYTLTGGSAIVINSLEKEPKAKLLQELFGTDSTSIKINVLRISMGASDLSASVFTYADVPTGTSQLTIDLTPDKKDLIPLLKEIKAINPNLKLLATPWSAPVWMKTNQSFKGGSLLPAYYEAYAQYFVKYIQAMEKEGLHIFAVTPQNEPLNPDNNPSMYMDAAQQATWIKHHLGPAFKKEGISTKIIVYDHNCDKVDYPLSILQDAEAASYVDGSAFHLYGGDINAMSTVHQAFPDKNLYFTEQYTDAKGDFGGDLFWHMKNVVIGSLNNWSRMVLEWNLATDASFGPHTVGGCNSCKGAITIPNSKTYEKNVSFYILGQIASFLPPESQRINLISGLNLPIVAFLRPDGTRVLLMMNESESPLEFGVQDGRGTASVYIPAKAVATYVWNK